MGFSQKGDLRDLELLGARMRAAKREAGSMIGAALVKRAKEGMLTGPKSGKHYPRLPNQSSAPGEFSANQTGRLLNSIAWRMSGSDYLSFYATADHAGFQEHGTSKMAPRPNLKRAIDESDGLIRNILEQIIWRAIKGGR